MDAWQKQSYSCVNHPFLNDQFNSKFNEFFFYGYLQSLTTQVNLHQTFKMCMVTQHLPANQKGVFI